MTIHGFQFRDPAKRALPTAYYDVGSGVGLALLHHPRRPASLRIGVVGLGIGTLAAYAKSDDYVRFYEINPAVIRTAEDARYFTYLRDCAARFDVVPGDARLSLERELEHGEPQEFDVLTIDAFSGDAIPVHLLTLEAFRIYLAHLRTPGGILAVHISNRSLDLLPVVYALADRLGLEAASVRSRGDGRVANTSHWVLVARDRALLGVPEVARVICPRAMDGAPGRVWTDDDSDLFRVLKAPPPPCTGLTAPDRVALTPGPG